jgi:Acetyltransferase (GNAT) family
MIRFAPESSPDTFADPDFPALMRKHYEELRKEANRPVLDPDWAQYEKLADSGMYHMFTARDDGKLVGYAAYFIAPNVHYKAWHPAVNDIIYLDPASRQATAGVRFLRYLEVELAKLTTSVIYHVKPGTPMARAMERLGYKLQELSYGKFF